MHGVTALEFVVDNICTLYDAVDKQQLTYYFICTSILLYKVCSSVRRKVLVEVVTSVPFKYFRLELITDIPKYNLNITFVVQVIDSNIVSK